MYNSSIGGQMIKRDITRELKDSASEYSVVTIFGPRQSGKTTLVKMTFPKYKYVSMEDPDQLNRAEADPREFLNDLGRKGIIDEIQRAPFLLSYIQGVVDNQGESRKFILTGSHQPALGEAVSQSLAGRSAILNLLPFSIHEIGRYSKEYSNWELVLMGGYPAIYEKNLKINRFFNGYVRTYVERDVRQIISIRNIRTFQQFLQLAAGRTGNLINYFSLAGDTGVSSGTIKEWFSVMEASFILFLLPPYFENIRKRVVKSPKLYFFDTGLVSFLLGIHTSQQIKRDPLRGALFENAVILEIKKYLEVKGIIHQLFFYRDSNGNEVDVIIKKGRKLIPIEIKSAETFNSEFLKGIKNFLKANNAICETPLLFYNGTEEFTVDGIRVLNPFIHKYEL